MPSIERILQAQIARCLLTFTALREAAIRRGDKETAAALLGVMIRLRAS